MLTSCSASDFLVQHQNVPLALLENAKEICISGITLSRTPRQYPLQLDRCLEAHGHVRLMILESEQHLLEECVKRSHGGTTVDFWRIRLESSVAFIKVLAGNLEVPGTV